MQKQLLTAISGEVPWEVRELVGKAPVWDSSCSPEARVYYVERTGGCYVKRAARGSLAREAAMTRYFHELGLGAEVLLCFSGEDDWLVTAAVPGEDGVSDTHLADPQQLCDVTAAALRALHECDFASCPVQDRTAEYLAFAEEGYRAGRFDASLFTGGFAFSSAKEAHDVLEEGKGELRSRVLLHGDYCLPNIMLNAWRVSGFIDVGCGGVGDRHIDLFWGVWTFAFNLKTDRYRARFLDAYGRDKVNEELLRVVAAAEVFG